MPITYADDEAEPLPTEWNWEGRCPRGAVVLVAGWRESAKGLLTWNITAAATNGALLPGEEGDPQRIAAGLSPKLPADVVMISAEDHLNEDKAWRARAAGCDLARVHDMTELDDGSPFELSGSKTDQGDVPELLAFLRKLRVSCMCGFTGTDADDLAAHLEAAGDGCGARNPRWVFMDPLKQLALDGAIARSAPCRRMIGRLERVARLTGVTIFIVHHYVKSGSIGGAQDLVDTPRWVYEIQPDPAVEDCKVIVRHKTNKARPEDIRYRIVVDGSDSRIEWVEAKAGAESEERSWRGKDDLAARREAKMGGTAAGPLPAAVPVSGPPPLRVAYNAFIAKAGRPAERILAGTADPSVARAACEGRPEARALADAGMPLQWAPDGKGGWKAGTAACAFAVGAHPVQVAAV